MRTTRTLTISLPPSQLEQAERLAKKQNRTMSELMREALRRYQEEDQLPSGAALRKLSTAVDMFRKEAKRTGLNKMTGREIDAEIKAVRKESRSKPKKRKHNGA